MGTIADLLNKQTKPEMNIAQALKQNKPQRIAVQEVNAKIQDDQTPTRQEMKVLGVTSKTSAKERKLIANALKRRSQGFDKRPDGTAKGKGFFGELPVKGGGVATEYSVGVQLESRGGKETDIPSLVPTLTKEERDLLLNDIIPNKKRIPESIVQKAVDHANARVKAGKNVFAQEGEVAGKPKTELTPLERALHAGPAAAAGATTPEQQTEFVRGFGKGFARQTQIPALSGRQISPPATPEEKVGQTTGALTESILELVGVGAALKVAGFTGRAIVKTALTFGTQQATQELRKGVAEHIFDDDFGYEGGTAVIKAIALGAALSIAGTVTKAGTSAIWSKLRPSEQARALKLLGLKKGVSLEAINKAARQQAAKFHPDKVAGMREQFEKVINARDVLRQQVRASAPPPPDIVRRGAQARARGRLLPGQVAPKAPTVGAQPTQAIQPTTQAPTTTPVPPVQPTTAAGALITPTAPQDVQREGVEALMKSKFLTITPKKGTVAAKEARVLDQKITNDQETTVVNQSMDDAANDDGKPNISAYDAPEFQKAVEDLVGNRNWEIAQAQAQFERRTKSFSSKSMEAATLNIQYRNRPELLEVLEKTPKAAKFKNTIEHSKNLSAKEKVEVAKIEAGYAVDLARAQELGVIESSQEHYINQIWNLPTKGKGAVKAQKFGEKMAESKERRILGGYLEGIQLGFEPVTLNAAKLRRLYQENLAKAIHEKAFLDSIQGMRNPDGDPVLTKITKETDWKKYRMIDHPSLRNYRFKGSKVMQGEQSGAFGTPTETQRTVFLEKTPMGVHRDAAPKLKALLLKSTIRNVPVLRQALQFSATGKYMLLSFSGFHHTALGKTAVFYGANPAPFGSRSYISGLDLIENNDTTVELLVKKGGLTLGQSSRIEFIKDVAGEPFEYLARKGGMPGRALNKAKQWWDKGLWDHYYVGLKAISGKLWFQKVRGMYPDKSDAEIAKIVANDINNNYGGLNWELLGVSKTHLDIARLMLLAPDWTISNWRFFLDAAKVSKGYKAARTRISKRELTTGEGLFIGADETAPSTRYMGRVIATLGTLTGAVNLALWGKVFPHEPEDLKSKWYMVKLPFKTNDGAYYYLDIFSHFFEPIRAVSDPIRWAKGKRSVGWKTVEETVTGKDWKGEYIKSVAELYEGIEQGDYSLYKSRFSQESTGWGSIPTRVIHGTTSFIPIPVQTAIDIGTGNKKAVEAASGAGLAVRRGRRPETKKKKKATRKKKKKR